MPHAGATRVPVPRCGCGAVSVELDETFVGRVGCVMDVSITFSLFFFLRKSFLDVHPELLSLFFEDNHFGCTS